MKSHKYHATKARRVVDGKIITFDSKTEARRFDMLLADPAVKVIDLQVPYVLVPATVWSDGHKERAVKYVADFRYVKDGETIVEDVKGVETREFRIKRKLMKMVHGIEVRVWKG